MNSSSVPANASSPRSAQALQLRAQDLARRRDDRRAVGPAQVGQAQRRPLVPRHRSAASRSRASSRSRRSRAPTRTSRSRRRCSSRRRRPAGSCRPRRRARPPCRGSARAVSRLPCRRPCMSVSASRTVSIVLACTALRSWSSVSAGGRSMRRETLHTPSHEATCLHHAGSLRIRPRAPRAPRRHRHRQGGVRRPRLLLADAVLHPRGGDGHPGRPHPRRRRPRHRRDRHDPRGARGAGFLATLPEFLADAYGAEE